jgi:hypothetical protein
MKFIGVDPAFRKNGFWCAIIERPQNTVRFVECKNLGAFTNLLIWEKPDHILIENSNLQKLQFNPNASNKERQNVGMNMAVSQISVDIATEVLCLELPVEISPKKKGAKIADLNLFEAWLKANTLTAENYKGNKTEQDKRDAAKLAIIAEQQYKLHMKAKKK